MTISELKNVSEKSRSNLDGVPKSFGRNEENPTESHIQNDISAGSLLGDIVADFQTLFRQELSLAKAEMNGELSKAKSSLEAFCFGFYILALAGTLLAFSLGYAVSELLGMSYWITFGILGILVGAIGIGIFGRANHIFKSISLVPQKTLESIIENFQWPKGKV